MEMNKEKYEDLLLRFAKELHEVGVSDDLKKLVEAQYTRHPNVATCNADEVTDRFRYQFGGFLIEATRSVKITVRKASS